VYSKASGLSHNEINNNNNNKHTLSSNTKGYGGKTHQTDSQNSDATAPSSRELYHSRFSFQAASPEPFGYTLVYQLLKDSAACSQSCNWTVPYTYKRLKLYSAVTFPGKRLCAGKTFARHVMFLILSALLQNFTVKGAPWKHGVSHWGKILEWMLWKRGGRFRTSSRFDGVFGSARLVE
jgi:hypothetical protein